MSHKRGPNWNKGKSQQRKKLTKEKVSKEQRKKPAKLAGV